MKRQLLTSFFVLAFVLSLGGCASLFGPPNANETSLSRVKRLENVYNASVRVLLLARTSGNLNDADYDQITKLIKVGDEALDKLNELGATDPNFKLDENAFFVLLNSALDQLALYSTRYDNGPGNGSTNNQGDLHATPSIRGSAPGRENYARAGRAGNSNPEVTRRRLVAAWSAQGPSPSA